MAKIKFKWDLEKDKDYQKLDEPILVLSASIICVGLFPYQSKRIRGVKVPSEVYLSILDKLEKVLYNKTVIVFENLDSFNSAHMFALFFHDDGCIIGELEDIEDY